MHLIYINIYILSLLQCRESSHSSKRLLSSKTQRSQWQPSTVAWKIPWTEEPGGLQSMGLQRVGRNWASSLLLFTFRHWRRKWQPTPVFLPGESQGRGAWWAAVYGDARSRTRLKWLSSSSSSKTVVLRMILGPLGVLETFSLG